MKRLTGSNKGVSVMEMLSSLTIICILAALMIGAIGAAREKSSQSRCINNQHQMISGIILYALDTEKFPDQLSFLQSGTSNVESAPSYSFFDVQHVYADMVTDYFDGQQAIMHCPKVQGTIFDNPPVYSYGYNNIVRGVKYSNLTEPSKIIVIADASVPEINNIEDMAYRHLFGAVASFADGHVEWFKDFYPVTVITEYTGEGEEGGGGGSSGPTFNGGHISVNPSGASGESFEMQIVEGTLITRSDLLGHYDYDFEGQVSYVRIKPNSPDDYVNIDGEVNFLDSETVYRIEGDDLMVHLYNTEGHGMGHWTIDSMQCSINCTVNEV
ncbi:MAG: hypothetical protein Q8Q33_02885 [Chlamydiota bacterium]|nr:hypothetical protein [Chlamydiota bacterium]